MRMDPNWPTGTITFLFADIEGRTTWWERHHSAVRPAPAKHAALLHTAVICPGFL